jgi:hypothetical protein
MRKRRLPRVSLLTTEPGTTPRAWPRFADSSFKSRDGSATSGPRWFLEKHEPLKDLTAEIGIDECAVLRAL